MSTDEEGLKSSKAAAVELLSFPDWLITYLYLEEASYRMLSLEMVAEMRVDTVHQQMMDQIMQVS